MKRKIYQSLVGIIICLWLNCFVVSADSSANYYFEEGGIDNAGQGLKSNSYFLNDSLSSDLEQGSAESSNYQELTGYPALQVFCGNHIREPWEECDDGNRINGDGCSKNCALETICGNGVTEGIEECDDGNIINGDGCSNICELEATVCGNWLIEWSEECDDGNLADNDGCSSSCALEALCGNGVIEGSETCDDGNLTSGDGCNNLCQNESVVAPPSPSSSWQGRNSWSVCGNRVIELNETCDDGNLKNGDGCSHSCKIENKKQEEQNQNQEETHSSGEEKTKTICGNGILEGSEKCDDGNLINNDGCNNKCRIEKKSKEAQLNPQEKVDKQIFPPEKSGENQDNRQGQNFFWIFELWIKFLKNVSGETLFPLKEKKLTTEQNPENLHSVSPVLPNLDWVENPCKSPVVDQNFRFVWLIAMIFLLWFFLLLWKKRKAQKAATVITKLGKLKFVKKSKKFTRILKKIKKFLKYF